MAKLAPHDLAQVLSELPKQPVNSKVIVGYETSDDAGVFRLSDDVALVQTVDFFTPVADDPEIYGRIAGVNALNDIYAMGGKPISALAIVCYPQKEDLKVLGAILRGGQAAMNEDSVTVIGGHTIDDAEIKFGYAVTGLIHPGQVITNANAQPGDALVLSKPIGTGAISTGIKKGIVKAETIKKALQSMTTSAAIAAEAMRKAKAHACTDVTGFGLLGHAYEMARASKVTFTIEAERVPLLPDVLDLIKQGMLTRGDKNNRKYVGDTLELAANITKEMQSALFDPQTAGGLLISIEKKKAEKLAAKIGGEIIGKVEAFNQHLIKVI